jgi:hypothetical protein
MSPRGSALLGTLVALLIGGTPAAAADSDAEPVAAQRLLASPLRAFPPTLPVTDGVDITARRTVRPRP